jgi:hypothetical protein
VLVGATRAYSSKSHDFSMVVPLTPNSDRGRRWLNSLLNFTNSGTKVFGGKGVYIDEGEH